MVADLYAVRQNRRLGLVRPPAPLLVMGFTAIGHVGALGRDPCALDKLLKCILNLVKPAFFYFILV